MSAETLRPDGQLSCSGLATCDFLEHDEDPDVSTTTINATGNNTATEYGVDFPVPSGDPTVGAGLQEFRAGVLEFDSGQTGTPTARIELWENGSLVRAGSNTNVSTFAVLSFTWNASELATADGSLAQCKVIGTKTGGSPSTRNTVRIGHIEWNAGVDAAAPVTGDGSSTGTATVIGDGVSTAAADGTLTGAATVTGDGVSTFRADGTSAGIAAVTAVGLSIVAGDGASVGIATATAGGVSIAAGDGSIAATATVLGGGASIATAPGLSAGLGVPTGIGAATAAATGSVVGVATATATGRDAGNIIVTGDGASAGVAIATGVGAFFTRVTSVGPHPEDSYFDLLITDDADFDAGMVDHIVEKNSAIVGSLGFLAAIETLTLDRIAAITSADIERRMAL
ncbi:MAG: hypothetical protein V3S55_06410 [Nitrospiraceae bacterium]